MAEILVLANETIGGEKLLDAIRERHAQGDARFHVVVPQTRPRHGNVIYDEAVRDSAQVRVDLALAFMREEGIDGRGEVGDGDPLNAAKDAIADHGITEIIVSTLPASTSGWMKRDLIEALENDTGLPVTHVVVDLASEGLPFDVTLVVANQTVAGGELVDRLKALADEGPRRFIIVVPQDHGEGARRPRGARAAADAARRRSRRRGSSPPGMIGDPDPYTATMNAVQFFHISEIVISTLPEGSSEWMADKLVERVHKATGKPVEHVESVAPRRWRPDGGRLRRPRASRAAAGQPLVAGRPRAARDAAFHHLRGDGLRGLLHGLLLHPGRGRAPSGRRRASTCRRRSRASTPRS